VIFEDGGRAGRLASVTREEAEETTIDDDQFVPGKLSVSSKAYWLRLRAVGSVGANSHEKRGEGLSTPSGLKIDSTKRKEGAAKDDGSESARYGARRRRRNSIAAKRERH
jgi:hypothetical protein